MIAAGAYALYRKAVRQRGFMDDELRILGRVDLPAALDALDDRVIRTLGVRRREAVVMRRVMTLAAVLSLGGGILAGSVVPRPAEAASPLSPLAPASVLAPSSLLDAQ
jgi:hypothetical protein